MNTSNVYQKHLTLEKRNEIERGLNENKNFTEIAKSISKSVNTVSNEIRRNRQYEYNSSWISPKFKKCEKLNKPPYVCNRCPSRFGCHKHKYYYYASDAQTKYESKRSESRKGIDMTCTEFKQLNKIVSEEIKQGHSFAMIIRNHKDEFSIGKRTLYNYVEKGYLDIINLDLPRKVRYKKRKQKNPVITKDKKIRINRTYTDFKDFIKTYNNNNFNIDIVEMDTVEGTKGDSVLLTLLWRQANFMLAYKLENKDSESVSKFFLELKRRLGYEKFHILFPIILTDNGVEFSKPDVIEYNGNHVYKTKLFYCDPGASNQKGKLENNHEYIRRFIEKGNSFDLFNQDDINLMINHINSVKRDSLDGDNPYTLMIEFLPQEIIDLFDIEEIEQNKIILKKPLFKYKKKDR